MKSTDSEFLLQVELPDGCTNIFPYLHPDDEDNKTQDIFQATLPNGIVIDVGRYCEDGKKWTWSDYHVVAAREVNGDPFVPFDKIAAKTPLEAKAAIELLAAKWA